MSNFKLLLIEDDDQALDLCQEDVNEFEKENSCKIDLVKCKNLIDANSILNNSFDGVIIDLKLDNQGDGSEGNKILIKIEEMKYRIPIAILTATPGSVDILPNYIGVFKKGDKGAGYHDLLVHFWDVYNTGITRIMGGRGKIEESLGHVFNENLMPEQFRKRWIEYGKVVSSRTEKAMLRHVLNHLLQLLDEDDDSCFPEEVYIIPPITKEYKTGSIILDKKEGRFFVIMTPACDLVIRNNGERKTDRILVVEIDSYDTILKKYISTNDREKSYKNALTLYYHWLPKTSFFNGGYINFRKLNTMNDDGIKTTFGEPIIQISPSFVKDIISRFSTYYARQGQPEIDNIYSLDGN